MDSPLERIEASAIDGRAENVRFRQDQLQNLHRVLREQAVPICTALTLAVPGVSPTEAEAEYAITMDAVRHFYDGLDFERELEGEYRVAKGRTHERRRVAVGIVLVRPCHHTRLYSIVTPLAAAVAAGNCVVIELAPSGTESQQNLDRILSSALTKALDVNTFYVSSEVITDQTILARAVIVDQTGDEGPMTTTHQPLSLSKARTVAVVDRTADLDSAAKAITRARFSFDGRSPYAPDLVLVNEFVEKPFFEACSRYVTRPLVGRKVGGDEEVEADEELSTIVREAEGRREVVSFGTESFKLVRVLDRDTPLTAMKITGRYLPIAICSSLVDAVFSQQFENPLLAGYVFADPPSAKYISQYLTSHITCVNHIPAQLLVGPAAPVALAPEFTYRYSPEMFSVPRPQFVAAPAPTEALRAVEELLDGAGSPHRNARKGLRSAAIVKAIAARPLKPTGQPKTLEGLDFFASGLFLGGGLVLAVVVPAIGWTSYVLGKGAFGYIERLRRQ